MTSMLARCDACPMCLLVDSDAVDLAGGQSDQDETEQSEEVEESSDTRDRSRVLYYSFTFAILQGPLYSILGFYSRFSIIV